MKKIVIVILTVVFFISSSYYLRNRSSFESKGPEDYAVMLSLFTAIISFIGSIITIISQILEMRKDAQVK